MRLLLVRVRAIWLPSIDLISVAITNRYYRAVSITVPTANSTYRTWTWTDMTWSGIGTNKVEAALCFERQ